MHQPGVDVRPLVEMTGHAMFNEVFLSGARVADAAVIGDRGDGWAAANTTLAHERAGLGAGGGGAGGGAMPGTVFGHLDKRAGDFAPQPGRRRSRSDRSGGGGGGNPSGAKLLIDLAKGSGAAADPALRQDLMKLHTLGAIGQYNNLRLKAARAAGMLHTYPGQDQEALNAATDQIQRNIIGERVLGLPKEPGPDAGTPFSQLPRNA